MILKTGTITIDDFVFIPYQRIGYVLVAPHLVLKVIFKPHQGEIQLSHVAALILTELPLGPEGDAYQALRGAHPSSNHWNYRNGLDLALLSQTGKKKLFKKNPNWEYINKAAGYVRGLTQVRSYHTGTITMLPK